MNHQNADWLRDQIEIKRRTFQEVADECCCTKQNIIYFARKFDIKSNNPPHTRKGRFAGDKSPNWRGGSQRYSWNWSELSEQVRRIANYTCSQCGVMSKEPNKIYVHHIDHNPRNNRLDNLLVVCASCHLKIHYREGRRVHIPSRSKN